MGWLFLIIFFILLVLAVHFIFDIDINNTLYKVFISMSCLLSAIFTVAFSVSDFMVDFHVRQYEKGNVIKKIEIIGSDTTYYYMYKTK